MRVLHITLTKKKSNYIKKNNFTNNNLINNENEGYNYINNDVNKKQYYNKKLTNDKVYMNVSNKSNYFMKNLLNESNHSSSGKNSFIRGLKIASSNTTNTNEGLNSKVYVNNEKANSKNLKFNRF